MNERVVIPRLTQTVLQVGFLHCVPRQPGVLFKDQLPFRASDVSLQIMLPLPPRYGRQDGVGTIVAALPC